MFRFPDLSNAAIEGPFWTARVRVVQTGGDAVSAARALNLTDFDRFAQPFLGVLGPRQNDDDPDFTVMVIPNEPRAVIAAPVNVPLGASVSVAALTKSSVPIPDSFSLTGRLRFLPISSGAIRISFRNTINNGANGFRDTFYALGVDLRQTQDFRFFLGADPATEAQISGGRRFLPVTAQPDTWFRFRIEVIETPANTTIKAKVWRDETPEPEAFQTTAVNSSAQRPRTGSIGLRGDGDSRKFFDDLSFGPPAGAGGSFSLRTLFTNDTQPHDPNTVAVLCQPIDVRLTGSDFHWTASPPPLSATQLSEQELRSRLRSGELSLLLLRVNSTAPGGANVTLTCIGGSVNLSRLTPEGQTVNNLRARLVEDAPPPAAGTSLSVNASGLSIVDTIRLPWTDQVFEVPLLLSRTASAAGFRLSLDPELITETQKRAVQQAWLDLSFLINPKLPLNRKASTAAVPNWTTLELADPLNVPRFFRQWDTAPWISAVTSLPPLTFSDGQFTIVLADQQPYDANTPPTSLARLVAGAVSISKTSDRLLIQVNDGVTVNDGLAYTATRNGTGSFDEQFKLTGSSLAFDPVETPRTVRGFQQVQAPEWEVPKPNETPVPIDTPVLWGFMPLEDGWAQLPIPNLTEKIYLDARIALEKRTEAPQSSLQGAVSFSNDHPDVLAARPQEQAWRMTVISASACTGTWTLTSQGQPGFTLSAVDLRIQSPEVVIDGLFWLSTGKPSPQDALPELTDWVASLRSIPLRTVRPGIDLFPAPVVFDLDADGLTFRAATNSRLHASLGNWGYTYRIADALNAFEQKGVIATGLLTTTPPLLWRRHANLPMIQALPLTQSQTPPNYPSASRQLAPYAVADGTTNGWKFGVTSKNGAAQFPSLKSAAVPAAEWKGLFDLPMASLSLPGVFLDPRLSAPEPVPQYRLDLPYCDQINALAQLPKVKPDTQLPGPQAPAPEPPRPLVRETLGEHWRKLSTQASLAAADAVNVRDLIGPFPWNVTPQVELEYPGAVTLESQTINALEGVTGDFAQANGQLRRTVGGSLHVTAGSMAAVKENDRFRDQRGLLRGASAAAAKLIKTPVDFGPETLNLVSAAEPLPLNIPGFSWPFWFRDLPMSNSVFQREPAPFDVNDPEAQSETKNFRNGYEWRIGFGSLPLPFFQLEFYPLTLERVEAAAEVTRVEIIGRLQLPLSASQEQTDFQNAVKLVFNLQSGELTLTSVSLVSEFAEWPLALNAGVTAKEPRLLWRSIALNGDRLEIGNATLDFFLFDEFWSVPVSPVASFPSALPLTPVELDIRLQGPLTGVNGAGLFCESAECVLNMPDLLEPPAGPRGHSAFVRLSARLGDTQGRAFQGNLKIHLLESNGDSGRVEWVSGKLFNDLTIVPTPPLLTGRSLQFAWSGQQPAPGLQLLPGMLVDGAAGGGGFAAITFDVSAPQPASSQRLTLTTATVEALIPCKWGSFLQDAAPGSAVNEEQVFGSSAGNISFGYTSQLQNQAWSENLLLNGFLEVKDLISWPKQMSFADSVLTLPAATQGAALPHLRHTLRVLFNQHTVPSDLLSVDGGNQVMFNLSAGKTWQFLAVVEHQLVSIEATVANPHRWAALQEVRIVRPAAFRSFLESHADSEENFGYLRNGLRTALIAQLRNPPANMLLVEASAPHFIRQKPINADTASTLQFLPGGSQQAILATVTDYHADPAAEPSWLLLATPFLGRLQRDDINANGLFERDPIKALQSPDGGGPLRSTLLALTSWAGTQNITMQVAPFDGPAAHRWPRLDPLTLEENFLRLQRPVKENALPGLSSVMATLVDTPARASRPTALRRALLPSNDIRADQLPALEQTGVIVWRQQSHMVTQGAPTTEPAPPYGWHLAGLQLISFLAQPAGYFPAATVVPSTANQVSYLVSPYLGLRFLPAGGAVTPEVVSAELVCLDGKTGALQPVASRLFPATGALEKWAAETHKLLSPESPVAVLRLRQVNRTGDTAQLTATYSFQLVGGIEAGQALTRRTFRIRADVEQLHFREASLGASAPPAAGSLKPFEIAPPQVAGVQPLYRNQAGPEPWGWSGLRVSVRYGNKPGIAAVGDASRWWQAPHYITQFRSATQAGGAPVASLPSAFRARAIKSLRPTLSDPPMPASASEPGWQPVIPDRLRYILTGGRAGTMVAMRNHLIRQAGANTVVSGSIPVQHRVPRPVELPPNVAGKLDQALRTWAGFFDPEEGALVTPGPADEAFFLGAGGSASRLRMTLVSPAKGGVNRAWNGDLKFTSKSDPVPSAISTESITVTDGSTTIEYSTVPVEGVIRPKDDAARQSLATLVGSKPSGDDSLSVAVGVRSGGLVQHLSFPLRLTDSITPRLPLEPVFIHFEDPEYNRRLASSSARASRNVPEGHTVTLAADRKIYNRNSTISLRYDREDDVRLTGTLELRTIGPSSVTAKLRSSQPLASGVLLQLELAKVADIVAGDKIELRLLLPPDIQIVLQLDLVEEPVEPVPEAAYALLRRDRAPVSCARFAWSPQAARIELVSAEDLRKDIVRRRAVFHWTDAARNGAILPYTIQKITANGSTHIPELRDPRDAF